MTDDSKLTKKIGEASVEGLGLKKKSEERLTGNYGMRGDRNYYSRYPADDGGNYVWPGYMSDEEEWLDAGPEREEGSPPQTTLHHTLNTEPQGHKATVQSSHIVTIEPPVKFGVGVELKQGMVFERERLIGIERFLNVALSQALDDCGLVYNGELREDVKQMISDVVRRAAYWSPDGSGFYVVLDDTREPHEKLQR